MFSNRVAQIISHSVLGCSDNVILFPSHEVIHKWTCEFGFILYLQVCFLRLKLTLGDFFLIIVDQICPSSVKGIILEHSESNKS